MRVKRIGARARPIKMAIPKPVPNPSSVDLLTRKEDWDGDNCTYSSESHGVEAQSDGVRGDDDDVEKVTRYCADIFGGDVMEVDSMEEEEEACIKCNVGGEVLFCCEAGCPVCLHEKCAGGESVFDDDGKFYCPYCLYKRALARTRELRERAMEAKKALSSFLDPNVVGGDKGKGKGKGKQSNADDDPCVYKVIDGDQSGQGHGGEETIANLDQHGGVGDHQKQTSTHVARDGENVCDGQEETRRGFDSLRDDSEREERCEDETSSTHQFEVHEGGERVQAEDSREQEHGLYERVVEHKHQAETGVDGSLNAKVSEDVQCRNEEQTQPQKRETFVSSTREKYERHAKKRTGAAEENARSKMECPSKESNAEKSSKDCVGKDADVQTSRQQQESMRETCISWKRKRALWTEEEEEMLKMGVKIVCSNANKNIPWRKVLDYGRRVFHSSRNPSALKDKWKVMNKVSK